MKYEILQTTTYDCGFTALKVMLANLNNDKNYLLMPELKGKKYSFLDLKEIAKEHELELEGYKIDEIEILDTFSFPMICQIKKGVSEHFVLLNKIKNNKYYIFDPSIGEIILTYEEFSEAFNHNALVYCGHKNKKYSINKGKINFSLLFSLIFNFFASLMLFISLIFISDYFLFFTILSLGIISIILQKIANQKFIKDINNTYNVSYDNLLSISDYQKYVIGNITNVPSKIILFFTIILMMNNSYKYGYLNVIVCLLIIGLYHILRTELKYEKNKIEYLEQCRYDLSSVNRLAEKYGTKLTLTFTIFAIIIAIFVFYMMQVNDLVGVDFFIMQFSLMFGALVFSKELLSIGDTFNENIRKKLIIDNNRNYDDKK